jgi:RHS repeat-associated protein
VRAHDAIERRENKNFSGEGAMPFIAALQQRVLSWPSLAATSVLLLWISPASFADPPPPPVYAYKWAAQQNPPTTDFVYDSFGDIAAARIAYVIAQIPGGSEKTHAHPGDNCDGNNNYTTTTGVDTGTVCAERKTSFACVIPGLDPPYWFTQCHNVVALKKCPDGFDWNGSQCVVNGKPDPSKKPDCCPTVGEGGGPSSPNPGKVGNPIHIGVGNKFQRELDYAAAGASGLRWERTYSSLDLSRWSGLGELWRHSYSRSIVVQTDGTTQMATMRRGNGATYHFVLSSGTWVGDTDINDRLTELTDGSGTRTGWSYLDGATQETEIYDVSGKLLSIANLAGLKQTLAYDSAGRLQSIADGLGRQLTLTYDTSNRIVSMTDPAGNVFGYAYANNNLTSVTYPDTTTRQYLYENASFPHALTGIVDENGNRYATFVYDSQGRATQTKHLSTGGVEVERYTITYDSDTSRTVSDPLGTVRAYGLQTVLRVPKNTSVSLPCASCGSGDFSSATYDANGNVASRLDFNSNRTNYTYDLTRNLETQRVEGLTSAGGTTAVTRTISTQWHATFRLPIQIAEPKRITVFAYDTEGNLSSKTVQATTDTNGSQGFSAIPTGTPRTWTYTNTYSGSIPGLMIQRVVDGPRTNVSDLTTYVWDNSGNLTSVTNALNQVTTLSNYDAHGRPQQITDPNGLVTSLSYDLRGRLTSRNVGGETTSYSYDNVGQLAQVTMPDGSYLTYTYDPAHRLTQIQDNLGNKIVYTLDAMGNRTQEQVFDPSSTLVKSRSRVYNNVNRLAQDIGGANPATEVTNYAYDNQGNLTTILDPLGHTTTNVYDALNRLIKVIDPAASGSGSGGNTQYAYDGLDQVTQLTDPRSLATAYTIDGLGNLTGQLSPDTGTTSATYDTAGNTAARTDARGAGATFSFDGLNRLTQAAYSAVPGGLGYQSTRTYTYDQGSFGKGHLTGFSDSIYSSTVSYTYNQKGRITQESRYVPQYGQTFVTGYSYDSSGRLSSMTYPSGRVVNYTRDPLGRISQITTLAPGGSIQTVVSAVTYQPFGSTKGWTFGNGATYSRSFDLDGRISGYSLAGLSRSVTYDPAGRITAFTHNNAVYNQNFGYDNLDRVTSWATASTNQGYGYDLNGNRTSVTYGANTYTYSYSSTSNRLMNVSGPTPQTYQYDAAGNVTSDGSRGYSYYGSGALGTAVTAQDYFWYLPDALQQRVSGESIYTSDGALFVRNKDGVLISENPLYWNTSAITEYIYLNGIPVAVATSPTALYYIYPDHLDTPRIVVNAANAMVWRWDSTDPFGSLPADSNPNGLGTFTFSLRFPGQYFNQETGLHYNNFRDYDPGVGRYIESDPVGLRGGTNTYTYVRNPLSNADPTGLFNLKDLLPKILRPRSQSPIPDPRLPDAKPDGLPQQYDPEIPIRFPHCTGQASLDQCFVCCTKERLEHPLPEYPKGTTCEQQCYDEFKITQAACPQQ